MLVVVATRVCHAGINMSVYLFVKRLLHLATIHEEIKYEGRIQTDAKTDRKKVND